MIKNMLSVSVLVFLLPTASFAQDVMVAGTQPDRRPANAPKITKVEKDADWYARALTGVEKPYPSSLRFLEAQGNWFNPFLHPGMRKPYDIRGWHEGEK